MTRLFWWQDLKALPSFHCADHLVFMYPRRLAGLHVRTSCTFLSGLRGTAITWNLRIYLIHAGTADATGQHGV
ncbi:hypothetical protein HGRIS_010865 [Hohenbuehelia grisea]|uniref:Uncharacterized protein n=1 Tax=Hohenbuehelia grisea TaxID=104357 RepID=A0ABR3IYJ0_9AGAR